MLHGDECYVCPVVWRSCKIGQMCKSPSAAESKALCDGEDEINAVRYQLAEMLGLGYPDDDKEEVCAKIPAVLATDSKNTYDNMGKIASFLNSKEKNDRRGPCEASGIMLEIGSEAKMGEWRRPTGEQLDEEPRAGPDELVL